MLSLLRKIRQKLLQQNRITQYLAYAIGEIALVMIGILLALQVNNWNENRKDNRLEQTFLTKLKSNLQDDIALYRDRIELNTNIINHMDSSLIILKNYKSYATEDLQEHLRHIRFFHRFNTNKTTFDNLLSSGRLDVIRNDSLTQELFLYYREISQNQESLAESVDTYSRNTIVPSLLKFDFLENALDINSKPKKSNFGLKPLQSYVENPEIVNHISHKTVLVKGVINAYSRQIKNAEGIKSLIDKELKPVQNH